MAKKECSSLREARARISAAGQWTPSQALGRRFPIGCVALEITQRCNLDCTLCYLSENAETVKDTPLDELHRRIEDVFTRYGSHTDVQVTGGEPTLRKSSDLVEIVRHIADRRMRPALFTNGIRAKRDLLAELSAAGLVDVAFHVDLTQERRGYDTEGALNEIRKVYIDRARGLPLNVIFNTSVFAGNFDEIAGLTAFFVRHSDAVSFASFQLHADTGRGRERGRPARITPDSVAARIQEGAGRALKFDAIHAGHHACNGYAIAAVANGRAHDLLDDKALVSSFLSHSAGLQFERRKPLRTLTGILPWALRNPALFKQGAPWLVRKAWAMRRDLVASRGRARKLSFFVHNFMDAADLDAERLEACAFMVATAAGPVPMCQHNAERDQHILKPFAASKGYGFWNPATGRIDVAPAELAQIRLDPKFQKGRDRNNLCSEPVTRTVQLGCDGEAGHVLEAVE